MSTEYMREWRKTASGKIATQKQKAREKARRKALQQFIKENPRAWLSIYDRCLRDAEIDDRKPPGTYGAPTR